MSYYLNVSRRILHNENCHVVRQYVKGNKTNWIAFGNLDQARKHCRRDNREYRYCSICCGNNGGNVVR